MCKSPGKYVVYEVIRMTFCMSSVFSMLHIWYIRKILVHVPRTQLRWWRTHHLLSHLFVTFCKELKTERKRWRKICLCRQSVAQCTPPARLSPLRTRERKVRRGRIEGRKDEMREGWKRRERIFSRLPGYVTSPRQNNFRSYGRQVVFARWSCHIDSWCRSRYQYTLEQVVNTWIYKPLLQISASTVQSSMLLNRNQPSATKEGSMEDR